MQCSDPADHRIWNDFLVGVTFGQTSAQPMTVSSTT